MCCIGKVVYFTVKVRLYTEFFNDSFARQPRVRGSADTMRKLTGLAVLLLLATWLPEARAQVLYGSLVVEARDQRGAALPGADVTITQTETGWTRSAPTSSVGVATFTTVPPGTFSVKVNLQGFKESLTNGVAVSEGSAMRVSSWLEVGQLSEAVTVTAGATVLQTERAEVRTELPANQLENVPMPVGRNYQSLFVTVPGISPPENMHSVAVNPARG